MKDNSYEYIKVDKNHSNTIEVMKKICKKHFNISLILGGLPIVGESLFAYLTNQIDTAGICCGLLPVIPAVGYSCYCKMLDNRYTKIQESSEYKECIELYDKYVTSIANLFKKLQIESPLEIAVLYNYILEMGYLSKDNKYSYHIFKNEVGEYTELYGTRITTGQGVCRHTASLLTDVLNKMGNTAATVPVLAYTEDDFIQEYNNIKNNKFSTDHCITGMLVDNQKVMYDSIHKRIATFTPFKVKNLVVDSSFFALGQGKLKGDQHLTYSLKKTEIEHHHIYSNPDNLEKILNSKSLSLSDDEILNIFTNAENKLQNIDLSVFYDEQKEIIERLSELNNIVMPHSDEKIKRKQLH